MIECLSSIVRAGNVDGVIVLEVTQNWRSCSFEDEVIVWAFPNSQKFGCCIFYARGRLSKELFKIVRSLKFMAKFSKKEKKFTNLVGDGMSKLRPIFPRWQGSIWLVWKQYCFVRTCWSVEMLQWFAVLDFVLILYWIQISQKSWSWVTEDSKNNKNGDILNDLVKQLWSFFCILNLTSLESYFILSWVCWHFWRWLCCAGTSYIIWILKIWV